MSFYGISPSDLEIERPPELGANLLFKWLIKRGFWQSLGDSSPVFMPFIGQNGFRKLAMRPSGILEMTKFSFYSQITADLSYDRLVEIRPDCVLW